MNTKKLLLLIFVLSIGVVSSDGQTISEPIRMEKVFGGYKFFQGDKLLTINQLVTTLAPNTEAYKQIKGAKSTYTATMVLATAGGALIGWPIGTAIGAGEPNWILAGVGIGLVAVSIPLSSKFNKQSKTAVDIFNGSLIRDRHI